RTISGTRSACGWNGPAERFTASARIARLASTTSCAHVDRVQLRRLASGAVEPDAQAIRPSGWNRLAVLPDRRQAVESEEGRLGHFDRRAGVDRDGRPGSAAANRGLRRPAGPEDQGREYEARNSRHRTS